MSKSLLEMTAADLRLYAEMLEDQRRAAEEDDTESDEGEHGSLFDSREGDYDEDED